MKMTSLTMITSRTFKKRALEGFLGIGAAVMVSAAPPSDKITHLPGLDKLPKFDMYSGYLNITSTKALHYWYVESQSNPDTDPVVLWLNGGPGCSSMEGFMAEHGPLHLNDDSTISMNPHAWNQKANMIYLEAPVGVGFSVGSAADKAVITDDSTATDNRDALVKFFTDKFPGKTIYLCIRDKYSIRTFGKWFVRFG